MKKAYFVLLSVTIMLIAATSISFANTSDTTFDVTESDGTHTTSAILVKDGVAYELSEEEYLELIEDEQDSEELSVDNENGMTGTLLPSQISSSIGGSEILPLTSYYYKFVPSSKSKYLDSANKKRVSAIYEGAKSLSVSSSVTRTRSIEENGGITVSAAIRDVVDAAVEVKYSYKKTATSSTSSSVTGTFKASGDYKYAAIIFKPYMATVKGTLQYRQIWDGTDSILSKYSQTWIYPVTGTSSGLLDGVYSMQESNSRSAFPSLA